METIQVNKVWFKAAMEQNEDGSTPNGYWGYTLGAGKPVAKVTGNFIVVRNDPQNWGSDMVIIPNSDSNGQDAKWCIWQLLAACNIERFGLVVERA